MNVPYMNDTFNINGTCTFYVYVMLLPYIHVIRIEVPRMIDQLFSLLSFLYTDCIILPLTIYFTVSKSFRIGVIIYIFFYFYIAYYYFKYLKPSTMYNYIFEICIYYHKHCSVYSLPT